ncbi:MAG: MCE family protein [Pirellulaceae bacterium]|jgi:phospholipid/cholesterol/gamma-HCH transport system substrate-binding protein|nr:MlaD family protein [Thermoguttaceae bacterium]MDI9445746.1 MlaD family protein [Planctomycetota bacterium]NLZ01406.1 MCE family protein [Pirellulaceae bacterium]
MDDRVMQWRIGLMVLVSLAILVIMIMSFGPKDSVFNLKRLWKPNYLVAIEFPEAPGVTDASPVRKSGILIGRVVRVELLDEGGALVTAEIERGRRLFNDEVCRINRTLLGDSTLEFVKRREFAGEKQEIPADTTLHGIVAPDPIQVVGNLEANLSEAIRSVATTSSRLGGFIGKLDGLIGDDEEVARRKERVDAIVEKTFETADAIKNLAETANSMLGDPELREQLKSSFAQLPQLMQETRQTIGRMNQTMTLVDRNLVNVEEFTSILGKQGGETILRLNESVSKLDRLMNEALVFSESLNKSQGTIGQLVNNPELYHSMNRAAKNVEELTQQLRPIISDARVFSDKIARHPELLGVRGAIKPEEGTKGIPSLGGLR